MSAATFRCRSGCWRHTCCSSKKGMSAHQLWRLNRATPMKTPSSRAVLPRGQTSTDFTIMFRFLGKVVEQGVNDLRWNSNLQIAYGSIRVVSVPVRTRSEKERFPWRLDVAPRNVQAPRSLSRLSWRGDVGHAGGSWRRVGGAKPRFVTPFRLLPWRSATLRTDSASGPA
jgi:hypothetical protein